jgi:hypothetical protein
MTIKPKIYTRLPLTEAEFNLARGALVSSRAVVFEKWKACDAATNPAETAFYFKAMNDRDALLARFDAVLVADTSQDAEPDEDEDEEEDET